MCEGLWTLSDVTKACLCKASMLYLPGICVSGVGRLRAPWRVALVSAGMVCYAVLTIVKP